MELAVGASRASIGKGPATRPVGYRGAVCGTQRSTPHDRGLLTEGPGAGRKVARASISAGIVASRTFSLVLAFLLLGVPAASASAAPPQELTLRMDDGVAIACSFLASQARPSERPAAGWPGVVLFSARGPEPLPFLEYVAASGYTVLTCDPRGLGASGGLYDLAGPRSIADVRREFDWLASQPEVDGKHLGAWGGSLGGGAVLNSVLAGVPWSAVAVAETWVDLYRALAPNDLAKTGLVALLASSVASDRRSPELATLFEDALAGRNLPALHAVADSRSPRGRLRQVWTPALILQGRRDFVFDMSQGVAAYELLRGPKALFIGDFGHWPSTYPGPDIDAMNRVLIGWFDRFLKGRQPAPSSPIQVSPDPWSGGPVGYKALPATRQVQVDFSVGATIGSKGRIVRSVRLPAGKLEMFGAPIVRARVSGSFTKLVAVLSVGDTIVSEGGTALSPSRKPHWVSFRLISSALRLPARGRLTLTLAATSTAQSAANLVYLVGVTPGRRLTVEGVSVSIPVLKHAISP